MIKNRPNASILPHPNRRILAELLGMRTFTFFSFAAFLGGVLLLHTREQLSHKLYNTRKVFKFKTDPYSGKINCTFKELPYKMSGF
jgi:hypothetical protein